MESSEESTPIENVLEVEKEHSAEAAKALAELNGETDVPPHMERPQHSVRNTMSSQRPYDDLIEDEDDIIESQGESMMDIWIQLCMTAVTVAALVFVFFSPRVRIFLEPMIGTGYVSLAIRSLLIGGLSLVPRLVMM